MKTFDGYKKQALTDVYALLAGGGHKPLSEFSMAHTHPYLPLSGGTITGNIILKGGTSADMTYAGNVHPYIRFDNSDSSLNVSLIFTDYDTYRRPAGIKLVGNQGNEWFEAANIYATTFYGALSGNASSATKLTSSAGNETLPIYFSDGRPIACTASSIFSNLSSSLAMNLSVTIAGLNRTITNLYARYLCYTGRPTSMNVCYGDGTLRYFLSTSTTTTGKPEDDSHILHFSWDNDGGWDSQLSIPTTTTKHVQWRTISGKDSNGNYIYNAWETLANITDNVASATKLQTSRNIWGQSFDGTGNVNGTIYINNSDSSNGAIRLNNDRNSNARISAISDQVIFNTGSAIRFGETAWDLNQWAGLKYTHSNKTIYLGIADGSIFNSNSTLSGGTLKFPGITTITPDSGARIGDSDGDLYLGNASNSAWVKVQDMCSQEDSNNWCIYQAGDAYFNTIDINGDASINGNLEAGQIIRDSSGLMWVNGRNGALLRETTSTGYHTLWSLKTTNGSWDFGEYNSSGWNNVPVLSYITDSNYNSGNNTPTYQIKFPLASGTVALINDVNNYYWANVKISDSSSTTTSPTVHTLTATRVCAGHNPEIDNSISCSNWFRSSGATGWYNTTYLGGWYMSDTSWIRAHNGVGIYTSGQIYSPSSIRMGNILLEHTDEINNSANGGLHLNYRSSGDVSLCQGGGNVGIGTPSPSATLDVAGTSNFQDAATFYDSINANLDISLDGTFYVRYNSSWWVLPFLYCIAHISDGYILKLNNNYITAVSLYNRTISLTLRYPANIVALIQPIDTGITWVSPITYTANGLSFYYKDDADNDNHGLNTHIEFNILIYKY